MIILTYSLLFMAAMIAGVTFWSYRVKKHVEEQQAAIKQEIESAMRNMNSIMPEAGKEETEKN